MRQRNRSICGADVRRQSAISLLVIAAILHSAAAVSQDLRIEHVTVVSPESAREIRSATVSIHDGRIQDISITASAAPASGSTAKQTLDGTKLYLIPGLIDSHVHLGGIPGMNGEQ